MFSLQATSECSKFSTALLTFELFGPSSVRNDITDALQIQPRPRDRKNTRDSSVQASANVTAVLNFKCNNSRGALRSYPVQSDWSVSFHVCMWCWVHARQVAFVGLVVFVGADSMEASGPTDLWRKGHTLFLWSNAPWP